MPESVTEFAGKYVPGMGIELTWTAPTDASSLSNYLIYWYSLSSGSWQLATTVRPVATSVTYSAQKVLKPAPTYYLFPWAFMQQIGSGNIAPTSVSFKIVHKNSSGETDDGVVLNAYSPTVQSVAGVPHFQNNFNIDIYGQVNVNVQDTYPEVVDSVKMLLGTQLGQRPAVPEYGTEDLPLHMLNPLQIQNNISTWEDRAAVNVAVYYDDYNNAQLSVSIENF
jgi:hypothetical protein